MEVIKSASLYGALAVNYLEAIDFKTTAADGRVHTVVCRDRFNGKEMIVRCKSCVNATGVWSDKLLRQLDPTWSDKVKPAKGTHIMLPLSCFETSTALFLPTPDGRFVFVVPWQKALMVGTTDIGYEGPLDNPVATTEEIDYLLGILNSYSKAGGLPGTARQLSRSDVIAAWAGLRPLVGGEHSGGAQKSKDNGGEKTATISREHLLFEGPFGVIGLIGGKLTNYRMLSIHVVDMALAQLIKQDAAKYAGFKQSKTDKIMLGGWSDKSDFLTTTAQISAQARKLSLEPATLDHLIATYGKDALQVIDLVEQNAALAERICPDFPPIMAEVPYCLNNEMAISLDDILSRRIRLGFVHQGQCLAAAPKVARLIENLSYWDAQRANAELEIFEKNMIAQLAPASPMLSPTI